MVLKRLAGLQVLCILLPFISIKTYSQQIAVKKMAVKFAESQPVMDLPILRKNGKMTREENDEKNEVPIHKIDRKFKPTPDGALSSKSWLQSKIINS